jgi:thiol-disulfide isomerase/thioredoxin
VTEPDGQPPVLGSRWGRISRPVRWTLVVVVLAVAVAVAVWPRGSTPVAAPPPPPNLTADRTKADLPACGTASAPTSALAQAQVTCLATGRPVDLGALLAGGPVLVNVWATWCQPCQQELPVLNSYSHLPGALRVVGIQVQGVQRDGLDLLTSLGVHLPMVLDETGAASRALHLPTSLPASYVVRPDGTATLVEHPSRVLLSIDDVRQAVATYAGSGGGA